MQNKGQIYASDDDGRRLAPIYKRLEKAGARNVQVRAPRRGQDTLADLAGACDLVLIDAPCTGTGAWRRNPDAKWRIRPGALEQRIADQDQTLAAAARFVKPRGRILYVTCSLLREENEDRIAAFLARKSRVSRRRRRDDGGCGGLATAWPPSPRSLGPGCGSRRRQAGPMGFSSLCWRGALEGRCVETTI